MAENRLELGVNWWRCWSVPREGAGDENKQEVTVKWTKLRKTYFEIEMKHLVWCCGLHSLYKIVLLCSCQFVNCLN